MAKKIYLSPERRPKPHGKYWGMNVYEHDVCNEIANFMLPILVAHGFDVKIALPEPDMEARVKEAMAWGADYYMPLHTNASTNGTVEGLVKGPEVHAYGKVGGVSYNACKLCYDELMKIYPRQTTRGIKLNTTFYEIINTPMLSVYPELAFHDNSLDANWLVLSKKEIAVALCKGIFAQYGVKYVEVTTPSVQSSNTAAELDKANETIASLRKQLSEEQEKTEMQRKQLATANKTIDDIKAYINQF